MVMTPSESTRLVVMTAASAMSVAARRRDTRSEPRSATGSSDARRQLHAKRASVSIDWSHPAPSASS